MCWEFQNGKLINYPGIRFENASFLSSLAICRSARMYSAGLLFFSLLINGLNFFLLQKKKEATIPRLDARKQKLNKSVGCGAQRDEHHVNEQKRRKKKINK